MAWAALFISAFLEAVWATALGQSAGFTQALPTIVFIAGILLSFPFLAYAARKIPMGTGYAVWTGTGAALTVVYAMLTGTEDSSPLKIVFLTGIIGSVIGLKIAGTQKRTLAVAAADNEPAQRDA
jgi:quaternary ammonium compound-resistance protein SugE